MEFVISGDFNINFLKDSIFKQKTTLLFQTYNQFQSIFQPELVSSAFDNVFIDHGRINSYYTSPIINGLSDHEAQYLVLSNVFNYNKNKTSHR